MYKRKKTHSGRLNTPVTFYRLEHQPPYPDRYETKEQFSCLAEVYESSTLDHQSINTTGSKHVITLIIPNPRTDYRMKSGDIFMLSASMYSDIEFDVEHFAPAGDMQEFIKIVGVSYYETKS